MVGSSLQLFCVWYQGLCHNGSSRSPTSLVAAWRSRARLRVGGPLGSGPRGTRQGYSMTEQEAIRLHHHPWRLQRVRSQCGGANGTFVSSSVGRLYRSFRRRSSRDHYAPMVVGSSTSRIKLDSGSSATTGPRLGLFLVGCLVALAWVLRTGEKWCSCLGCCCRRNRPAALPPVVDAALQHLPVTPLSGAFQRVSLVGPSGGTPVDTEYYQRQVRGRGAGRKANDPHPPVPSGCCSGSA